MKRALLVPTCRKLSLIGQPLCGRLGGMTVAPLGELWIVRDKIKARMPLAIHLTHQGKGRLEDVVSRFPVGLSASTSSGVIAYAGERPRRSCQLFDDRNLM